MANRDAVSLNTPCGRMIGGSLYQGRTANGAGIPLMYKTGTKIGQPRTEYSFGIALAKTAAHWAQEPGWGAAIWTEGHGAHPAAAQRPDFSWKIIDGDSTVPNKKGKKPVEQTGYPGHWVLWFTGNQPPVVAKAIGPGAVPSLEIQLGFCNPGDYIEVRGTVKGNDGETPGVYLQFDAVCMRGYGERIASTVDIASAGFGATPLPAGASAMPVGNVMAPPVTPPPTVPQHAVAPPAPVPVPVTPNAAVLGAPAPLSIPAPPVGPVMAPGCPYTYEQLKASNYSDEQMRTAGYLI
jgi:hypothetical protein